MLSGGRVGEDGAGFELCSHLVCPPGPQRLGGVHTVASRRLLTLRQEEERRMLRELQLRSADFQQVLEYRRQFSPTCTTCGLLEKIWTAKVTVSPQELRVPPRERLDICRHVERMQFARALRHPRPLPAIRRARPPATVGEGAGEATPSPGDGEKEEDAAAAEVPRQEIRMNVTFKSREPPKPLAHQPGHLRPFFPPPKRAERSIAGSTNRSLFHPADFPGDLMLMNQDFFSRGIRPSDGAPASPLPEPQAVWREPPGQPAPQQQQ